MLTFKTFINESNVVFTYKGDDFVKNPVRHLNKHVTSSMEKAITHDRKTRIKWKDEHGECDREHQHKTVTLPISKLYTDQSTVTYNIDSGFKPSNEPIKVLVLKDGRHLIYDGNHRVFHAIMKNQSTIKAKLILMKC